MNKLKVGTKVQVIGKCKSQFRVGVVTNGDSWFGKYRGITVLLDKTSDKAAQSINVLRKNVEAV